MRAVLQRVTRASVTVDGDTIASIGAGLLVLLGIAEGDSEAAAEKLAAKTADLRIFAGEQGRFDRSLTACGGSALVVSQFTLLADTRKGRRPSFAAAARPEAAERLVEVYSEALRDRGVPVETGRFGAHMQVDLVNDGPVTVILDTEDLARPRRS